MMKPVIAEVEQFFADLKLLPNATREDARQREIQASLFVRRLCEEGRAAVSRNLITGTRTVAMKGISGAPSMLWTRALWNWLEAAREAGEE